MHGSCRIVEYYLPPPPISKIRSINCHFLTDLTSSNAERSSLSQIDRGYRRCGMRNRKAAQRNIPSIYRAGARAYGRRLRPRSASNRVRNSVCNQQQFWYE